MEANSQAMLWIIVVLVVVVGFLLMYFMWQPAAPSEALGIGSILSKIITPGDKFIPKPFCSFFGETHSLADFLSQPETDWCGGIVPSNMRYAYGAILTGEEGGLALTVDECGKDAHVYFAPFDAKNPYQTWYLYYDVANNQGALVSTACMNDGTTASEKYGKGGALRRMKDGWSLADNTGVTFIEIGTAGACYGGATPWIRIDDRSRLSDWNQGGFLTVLEDLTAGVDPDDGDSFGIMICSEK